MYVDFKWVFILGYLSPRPPDIKVSCDNSDSRHGVVLQLGGFV